MNSKIELPQPRAGKKPFLHKTRWEKISWVYMRVSGSLLIVLIFAHLYSNLVAGKGVAQISYTFVVEHKFSVPLWIIWDALMLVLALIHGTNGMRVLVNDYVYRAQTRRALIVSLWTVCFIEMGVGLFVLGAFAIKQCAGASICG